MESIIQFLLTRKPEDSPKSMQGEVSSNSSSISALPMYQYLQYIYRFAESGGDTCSNTTTRLVYWMCNRQHFSMNQEAGNGSAKDLGAFAYNLATIPYNQTTLFVFHTPHHKFVIVRTPDGQSMVLHSNKDLMHTGRSATQFSLHTYLNSPANYIRFPTDIYLTEFVRRLLLAANDPVTCVPFFNDMFGIGFKPGMAQDYWFAMFPVDNSFITTWHRIADKVTILHRSQICPRCQWACTRVSTVRCL